MEPAHTDTAQGDGVHEHAVTCRRGHAPRHHRVYSARLIQHLGAASIAAAGVLADRGGTVLRAPTSHSSTSLTRWRARRRIPETAFWRVVWRGGRLQWVGCRPTRTTVDGHRIFLALALRNRSEVTGRFRWQTTARRSALTFASDSGRNGRQGRLVPTAAADMSVVGEAAVDPVARHSCAMGLHVLLVVRPLHTGQTASQRHTERDDEFPPHRPRPHQ
jgi:hypothetical protein